MKWGACLPLCVSSANNKTTNKQQARPTNRQTATPKKVEGELRLDPWRSCSFAVKREMDGPNKEQCVDTWTEWSADNVIHEKKNPKELRLYNNWIGTPHERHWSLGRGSTFGETGATNDFRKPLLLINCSLKMLHVPKGFTTVTLQHRANRICFLPLRWLCFGRNHVSLWKH